MGRKYEEDRSSTKFINSIVIANFKAVGLNGNIGLVDTMKACVAA